MMYMILLIQAIFTPRKLSQRIKCQHADLRDHLIDAGMDKRYWCLECGAFWSGTGRLAA